MRYFCGTPQDKCLGSLCKEGVQSHHKLHSSIKDAALCFKKYIISLGFVQDKVLKNRFVRDENEPAKFLDRRVS